MERLTKLLVLGWACAALCLQIHFLHPGWRSLPMVAAAAFGSACLGTAFDRRAVGAVLLFTYVFPVIVYDRIGQFVAPYGVVWMAALLGAMIPSGVTSRWHLSTRWRAALVCWALTVVVGATIVVAREFDFHSPLVDFGYVANSSIGGWPSYVATWTLHVALVNLIGILWFDWLSELPAEKFRSTVILPLGVGCAAMIAVAIYQLLADVRFLNPTVYASLTRASGTVLDANVCGTVAALWIGGAFVFMSDPVAPERVMANGVSAGRIAAAAGVGAGWLAVWATGSRTGFAAAIIVTLFGVAALVRRSGDREGWGADWRVLTAGGVAAAALVLLLTQAPLGVVGPLQRVRNTAPEWSVGSIAAFAAGMWNRSGYGALANEMIGSHPWVGIGAGGYHVMLADFTQMAGQPLLPPDNAQNWFRHQLVEFGLLGSVGCIGWLLAFGPFVLRRRAGEAANAWVQRGMLIAFAAVSMVGVPSQDVIAAVTFWTVAGWYLSTARLAPEPARLPWLTWVGVVLAIGFFAAPTVVAATTSLRVPVRAQRVGWSYSYGFYPAEPDAPGWERRWTARHAVAVVEAPTRRLALTVAVDPLGVNQLGRGAGPLPTVDVRVWVDQALVIDERVNDTRTIERTITIPPDERRVLIETRVSRTFRPRALGRNDDRELGMLARWRFLGPESPAAGELPRP